MNIQPWSDGDLAGQEEEGYKEGMLNCKQGWATDNSCFDSGCIETPYLRGYRRGWDDTFKAGMHGTKPIIRDRRLQPLPDSFIEEMRAMGGSTELQELLQKELDDDIKENKNKC